MITTIKKTKKSVNMIFPALFAISVFVLAIFSIFNAHEHFYVLSVIKTKINLISLNEPNSPLWRLRFHEFMMLFVIASIVVTGGYMLFYSCAVLGYSWIPGTIANNVLLVCMTWFATFAAIELVFWAMEIRQMDVELALKVQEKSGSLIKSKGVLLSMDEELTGVDFHPESSTSIKTMVLVGLVAGLGYLVFWIVNGSS